MDDIPKASEAFSSSPPIIVSVVHLALTKSVGSHVHSGIRSVFVFVGMISGQSFSVYGCHH
jgi:hypothetical protein